MLRTSLFLLLLGPGFHAWPRGATVEFVDGTTVPSTACLVPPVPQSKVWDHQIPSFPPITDYNDTGALTQGDFLGSGQRQLQWTDTEYTTPPVGSQLKLYNMNGSLPGYPKVFTCRASSGGTTTYCMSDNIHKAVMPLDDSGELITSQWMDPVIGTGCPPYPQYCEYFMKPDGTLLPWYLPSPTSYDAPPWVIGLRTHSGKWGVFGEAVRSSIPVLMLLDKNGIEIPAGWPLIGIPGYTIQGIFTQRQGASFPAGQPATLTPGGETNYAVNVGDDGQMKSGNPYRVPWASPYIGSRPTNGVNSAIVNGVRLITTEVSSFNANPGNGYNGACALYLYSDTGALQPGWPQPMYMDYGRGDTRNFGGCSFDGVVFADLDGDGIPEIVTTTNLGPTDYPSSGLFAWKLDGTPMPGFPFAIPGVNSGSAPVVGDIDGDGRPEILFEGYTYCRGMPTSYTGLFAYHDDGTPVALFPMTFGGWSLASVLQSPILDDFNGDGNVDITVKGNDTIYIITLNAPYNRDTIEWPMEQFDVMRTGWYRKMAHVDRAASWIETSAPAIPGDGQSSVWITAHGVRPNTQPILWPDQFVRFGRLPDAGGGEFSTFIDNLNGSWSQKLTAPRLEDPVTVTVSGWINEFKLNQTIPVTFWGRPRTTAISPRAFPIGGGINANLTGANYGIGVTLRALDADLQITSAVRITETAMTARFDAPSTAIPGLKYFVANAYSRDSSPAWVLAYDPNDLLLLLDKTAGATVYWYGRAAPNYQLLRDNAPTFPAPATIYSGPAMTTTDPINQSYFYLVIAN